MIGDTKTNYSQLRKTSEQFIIANGERDRFKELLKTRLIESGWKDEMIFHAKTIVKERGVNNVTVHDLVKEITPKGRSLVPDSVKKELLQKIKSHFAEEAGL